MKEIVIDNNVLFSLINPFSISSYIFSSIDIKFIAPEFIKEELEEHKEECIIKSNLSEDEFRIRLWRIRLILLLFIRILQTENLDN